MTHEYINDIALEDETTGLLNKEAQLFVKVNFRHEICCSHLRGRVIMGKQLEGGTDWLQPLLENKFVGFTRPLPIVSRIRPIVCSKNLILGPQTVEPLKRDESVSWI